MEYTLDSGASMSCIGQRSAFLTFEKVNIPIATYGKNGTRVMATGRGIIAIQGTSANGHNNCVKVEALYVPNAKVNLLSIGQLCAKGMTTTFLPNGQCVVRGPRGVELFRA